MKLVSIALASTLALVSSLAQAATTITFEQTSSYYDPILEFYNGGNNFAGASGSNYGISFSESIVSLANDGLGTGPNGEYFSNAPSGNVVMLGLDANSYMNVSAGFIGSASFGYSSDVAALGAVKIFSGLNGTGVELASFDLLGNSITGCIVAGPYCNFSMLNASFSGTARSIAFSGNTPNVLIDNITIAPVPEPATLLTMLAGLGMLGFLSRRKAK
jgi:PEP-CTERM motif